MHQTPRRILAKIVHQHGDDLIGDPRRTEALLNDLCGKHTREIFVLVQAQRRRVPLELRDAPAWMPTSTTINRLVSNLETQLALTPEAAAWAVESWAIALGLIDANHQPNRWTFLPRAFWPAAASDDAAPAAPARGPGRPRKSTAKPSLIKRAGQKPPNSVQFDQSTARSSARSNRPDNTRQPPAPLRALQRGWQRFAAFSRKQAPAALLWITILLISSLLGWALLDGAALSETVSLPGINNPPPAVTTELEMGPAGSLPPSSAIQAYNALVQLYAPPQTAWVTAADGLNRREAPSLDATALGLLAAGQVVSVIGYSHDGAWAQLDAPSPGWVSTQYLAFSTVNGQTVRIALRQGRVRPQLDRVALRVAPSQVADAGEQLAGATIVTIISATLDGQWFQLGAPQTGWILSAAVELDAGNTIDPRAVGIQPPIQAGPD